MIATNGKSGPIAHRGPVAGISSLSICQEMNVALPDRIGMHMNACVLMGCLRAPFCGGVGDSSPDHSPVHRTHQPVRPRCCANQAAEPTRPKNHLPIPTRKGTSLPTRLGARKRCSDTHRFRAGFLLRGPSGPLSVPQDHVHSDDCVCRDRFSTVRLRSSGRRGAGGNHSDLDAGAGDG